jgi:hypothetical protein
VVRRVRVLDVDAELGGGIAVCELVGVVTDDEDEPQLDEDSDRPYLVQACMWSNFCFESSAGMNATPDAPDQSGSRRAGSGSGRSLR